MKKGWAEHSDQELFDLIVAGSKNSENAFTELYNRYSPRVYAYCRRFLGNEEEAMDVFQETFIKFHQCADRDREMTNVPAFLLKIARNLCVNLRRREKTMVTFEDYMINDHVVQSDKDELLGLIKSALELLPDDYREVFILREYDGLSYQEITDVTGITLATVKVRIFRAKQKIREILAPYLKELSKYGD